MGLITFNMNRNSFQVQKKIIFQAIQILIDSAYAI